MTAASVWSTAAGSLLRAGWARLPRFGDAQLLRELEDAAPDRWMAQSDVGRIRQAGGLSGDFFDSTSPSVQAVGINIRRRLAQSLPADIPQPPLFNEVAWSKSHKDFGHHFITAHRDPPGVGGVIAIITLAGRARFRVWEEPDQAVQEWDTDPGDLVLLNGTGWPADTSQCPRHAVDPPITPTRGIITYRYNRRGPGADYFA